MNIVGMIVEYNPFHNGHLWHLSESRRLAEADFAIALMSGHFVQRGEPALFDKWARAEAAVRGGVDLILELPAVYAVRSAQYFATAGVRLFQELGIVTHLGFGAEHPVLEDLSHLAEAMEDAATQQQLKLYLKSGLTYAAALTRATVNHPEVSSRLGDAAIILTQPNNILAIEYLRAIRRYAPHLTPTLISRRHSEHHDPEITSPFASATAIRRAILNDHQLSPQATAALPAATARLITSWLEQGIGPVTWSDFSPPLLHRLRTLSPEQLSQLPEVSEGLHHRLGRTALQATDVMDLLFRLKSKRYVSTRLQRIFVHALLGSSRQDLSSFDFIAPPYARVLAFNKNGRRLLHRLRQESNIPIITKTAHYLKSSDRFLASAPAWQRMLSLDTLASDIYALGLPKPSQRSGGQDFLRSPVYVED
ncbi:MAG TPA: nucleotidyltransferase [Patescibacteria group bacterium]|nr:nucleotidyltransferase [Patescibacteria group bacterium]